MPSLFTPHPLVLTTAYSELKRQAREQRRVFVGSPGSVGPRIVDGAAYLYRQFYDALGKKKAEYLGSATDPSVARDADELRERIAFANGLLDQARFLAKHGYVRVDARTGAVVAALANHGLFHAGAMLVGSHAFGALLNELGIKSAAFLTEDVDVARARPLVLEGGASFASILAESTVPLTPIFGFDRKTPPTSYKMPGKDRLRVDLLVPTRGREVVTRPVPELHAHATALPHLDYLLDDSVEAVLVGREGIVPIRVPTPERFACHKLLVSQLRNATSEKRSKDVHQAAVLIAAVCVHDPAAIEGAFAELPLKKKARIAAAEASKLLEASGHPRAVETLRGLL